MKLKLKIQRHNWKIIYLAKSLTATTSYKTYSKLSIHSTDIYSMGLQKIILIPNMPDTKFSFFTSRLVDFNEVFAPLKPNGVCHCVVRHEAIAGRKAENITDSILSLISKKEIQKTLFSGLIIVLIRTKIGLITQHWYVI